MFIPALCRARSRRLRLRSLLCRSRKVRVLALAERRRPAAKSTPRFEAACCAAPACRPKAVRSFPRRAALDARRTLLWAATLDSKSSSMRCQRLAAAEAKRPTTWCSSGALHSPPRSSMKTVRPTRGCSSFQARKGAQDVDLHQRRRQPAARRNAPVGEVALQRQCARAEEALRRVLVQGDREDGEAKP